ncbi:MAG: sulfatase-like hydrolase/transferase, partial [Prolixibacteraceae bacterium]
KGEKLTWPGHSGAIDYGMISYEDDLAQDDGQATQEAIRQLDLNKDKPFFLAVGYRRPHAPFVAPEKYFFPYPLNTMHIPDPGDRSDVTDLAFTVHPPHYGEPEEMKKMKMSYLASVSFLDSQVGRLLQSLEDHGLMDNTIIVFFSDHGFHLGEHGQWHKFTLYEESTRVPLIIRVPEMTKPGTVSNQIVELVDLFPTLKELCGMPEQNQQLAGQSLMPLLKSLPESWKEKPAITQVRRGKDEKAVMGYSIRTKNYRYNEWWTETETPELVAGELYDLEEDPEEEVNQADNSSYDDVQEELSKLLEAYREP